MTEMTVEDLVTRPLRIATSKPAWRAYLSTILFVVLSVVLLSVAVLSYGLFYANYLPQVNVERVVHLQYGHGHPYGMASLGDKLVSKQRYDVVVQLELPRSPPNMAAGNFMLDLQLLPRKPTSTGPPTDDIAPIARSRRTAILTYTSPMVGLASTMTNLPLVMIGWKRETEQLRVPMMEITAFSRGAGKIPQALYLEIQADEKLMIYDARVEFAARFTGIRWIMYNHRIISLLLFTSVFYLTSLLSAVGVWALLWASFSSRRSSTTGPGAPSRIDEQDVSSEDALRRQIRTSEGTDSPDISDTPRTFPTYSRQPPLRYLPTPRTTPDVDERDNVPATDAHGPAAEADDEEDAWPARRPGPGVDSGIGTSMEESASTNRAATRRRSRRDAGSNGL